jgi:hypothetical protein
MGGVRRALPLLAVVALLAGCAGHPKPKPAPALSTLLAHGKSVHFVLDGTVKLDLQSILARLHHVPPFHIHAVGDASRLGLTAAGSVTGDVSGVGSVVLSGDKAYARTRGTWYDLGDVKSAADLLRGAHWTVESGQNGRPQTLHCDLHLTTPQLEKVSGLGLPFGIDGADVAAVVHLSHWGEPVTITPPASAVPLPGH